MSQAGISYRLEQYHMIALHTQVFFSSSLVVWTLAADTLLEAIMCTHMQLGVFKQ